MREGGAAPASVMQGYRVMSMLLRPPSWAT
jgi:hypothetical protein